MANYLLIATANPWSTTTYGTAEFGTAVWTLDTAASLVAIAVDTPDAAGATTAATVNTGNSSAGASGAITVATGTGVTGTGATTVSTGAASAGTSGASTLSTGTGTTGTGAVSITTGAASAGASGAISLITGTAATAATRGIVTATGFRTASVTAAAITGATVLNRADSGGVFSVSQGAAYDIDLPSPTDGAGLRFQFYLTAPAANSVTITVLGGAATFVGTIVNDVASVLPATGSTLTFVTGTAALGDNIEIISISTTLYLVRAVTSANGGITIA